MPSDDNLNVNSILAQFRASGQDAIRVTVTPELAMEMLELNKINRPLKQANVDRITRQISRGLWRYNGATIKITHSLDVLDGQHRLWAIIEAKRAVDTLIAFGIDREAFETIDTLGSNRTASDTVALEGQLLYRAAIGQALTWLVRYERGVFEKYREPSNRIENSDVKEAFRANPNIVNATSQAIKLRKLVNTGLLSFFYYILSNQNTGLADQMIDILRDPGRTRVTHPYYLLRHWLITERRHREPVKTVALMIKASNAAFEGREPNTLEWRPQGKNPDRFPTLAVRNLVKSGEAS